MGRGVARDFSKLEKPGWKRDDAWDSGKGKDFIKPVQALFSYGIPVVLASGNFSEIDKRDVIDLIPQVMERDNFPVINVRAATLEGKAAPSTQGKGT